MHILLRYPDGNRVDALLLSLGLESMRAVVRHRNETLEFIKVDDHWLSESGERVSIEAMVALQSAPKTMTAGRSV